MRKEENTSNEKTHQYDFLLNHGFSKSFVDMLNSRTPDQVPELISYLAPEYQELILNGDKFNHIKEGYVSTCRVVNNDKALEKALGFEYPEWVTFLHPSQMEVRDFPITKNLLVEGVPGSGKTVALVWRYISLYRKGNSQERKPLFLCRNETTADIVQRMVKTIGPDIQGAIYEFPATNDYNVLKSFFMEYSHVIIDEGQDLSNSSLQAIFNLLAKNIDGFPTFTIAFDLNQPVINTKNRNLFEELKKSFSRIQLHYSYRCSKQVLSFGNACLQKFGPSYGDKDSYINSDNCPLTGSNVDNLTAEKDDDVVSIVEKTIFEKHFLDISDNSWAIILTGFYNPEIKEKLLKDYPNNVFDAEKCKGRDFFAGIVIHYWNDAKPEDNSIEIKKSIFEPYVAVTRFRDYCLFYNIKKKFIDPRNIINTKTFDPKFIGEKKIRCDNCKGLFAIDQLKRVSIPGGHTLYLCKKCLKRTIKIKLD